MAFIDGICQYDFLNDFLLYYYNSNGVTSSWYELEPLLLRGKADLDPKPGKQVFVVVKGVAVSRGDLEPEEG